MKKRGKNFHLKENTQKLKILVLVLALVPMMLLGGFCLYRFQIFSHSMASANLEQLVLKHKLDIDFFLQEKLKILRFLSNNFAPEQFRNENFLQETLRNLREGYGNAFLSLVFIDKQGNQIAHAGFSTSKNTNFKEAEWFKKGLGSQHVISDVFHEPGTSPFCIVATSITGEDSRWILKTKIDFRPVNLLLDNVETEHTLSAFILNRKGEFQTRQAENYVLNPDQYLHFFSKERSSGLFNDDRLLLASTLIKNGDWLLIFQQNTSDAFSELKNTRNIAAIIFLLSTLIIAMVSFRLIRTMKTGILQAETTVDQVDSKNNMINQQIIESSNLASIGELASGIAHEINNPVAIMMEEAGWVQDLMNEGIDKNDNLEEFIRALKQIETQGRRCKEITQKLLSFGRKTDSRIQSIQLNELIEEVVILSSEKARHADVEIHTRLDPNLPEIQASITEMQQVLLNLVNNALDAMEEKGNRIEINSFVQDQQIIITVADNGPGIPAMNMNRLFDPFFSTKPVGKGSGLGLSICYGIVKKMGGKIGFESMLGQGTTFRIVLPFGDYSEYNMK
jgi:two-component system NtrC family sensor kinase